MAGIFSAPDSSREAQAEVGSSPMGALLSSLFLGAALIAASIYLLRGQGPTMRSVRTGLARARSQEVQAPAPSTIHINVTGLPESESAAAIQNLQNLMYTRAISESEYQAAKNKILGDL